MCSHLVLHADMQDIVYVLIVFLMNVQVLSYLSIQLRHKVGVHWVLSWSSQYTLINKCFQGVSLEQVEELLSLLPSDDLSFSPDSLVLSCSLLQVSSLSLINSSLPGSLHSLSLHQLSLLQLQEHLSVLWQFLVLILFNDFYLGIFKSLSY
jgi:uncharacterized membrane protein YkvI